MSEADDEDARKGLELAKAQRRASEQIRQLSPEATPPSPARRASSRAEGDTVRRTPPMGFPIDNAVPQLDEDWMMPEAVPGLPGRSAGHLRAPRTTGEEIATARAEVDRAIAPVLTAMKEIREAQKWDAKSSEAFAAELGQWRGGIDARLDAQTARAETLDKAVHLISIAPNAKFEKLEVSIKKVSDRIWGALIFALVSAVGFGIWIGTMQSAQSSAIATAERNNRSVELLVERTNGLEKLVLVREEWMKRIDDAITSINESIVELRAAAAAAAAKRARKPR